MTDDSEVRVGPGGTTFVGPDGVALFRATALATGLRLYARTGMRPNRAWTVTAMLKAAGEITGKTYKRNDCMAAAADLKVWADTMAGGIPFVHT